MSGRVEEVRLAVLGIEIEGKHGVYPQEQLAGNRFSIDVEMAGRFAEAVESDDLSDTVDYDAIVQLVREINRKHTYHLIESFAGAMADGLLDRFARINRVRIRIRKLSVESLGSQACAMVELSKRRA